MMPSKGIKNAGKHSKAGGKIQKDAKKCPPLGGNGGNKSMKSYK